MTDAASCLTPSVHQQQPQKAAEDADSSCSGLSPALSLLLPFVVRYCTTPELRRVTLLGRECASLCEQEWRLRVLENYGAPRFPTAQWRKCFQLRQHFSQKVVGHVTARVYLMNARGETVCFALSAGKTMMCSQERAIVYNRCERMFDLSLRINRSIQEISTLLGMVSVDEARGLLNEHINLMASVASLRSSLLFESELFRVFPAPVLLDTNALLCGTYTFPEPEFMDSSAVMMQVWGSIDGLIYRPLAPPSTLDLLSSAANAQAESDQQQTESYRSMKLHELSGMTISIDDNTLRYRLQQKDICINTLVGNSYLLYLFNPVNFRPLDWTYDAVLQLGSTSYSLPVQREGVFLNTSSYALRIFLSYGKLPESKTKAVEDTSTEPAEPPGARGSEFSDPLEIPYDGQDQEFSFQLTASNRVSKDVREIAKSVASLSLVPEEACSSQSNRERHVHLRHDAMICYGFAEHSHQLQYVEFAIGFESLLHQLGITSFLTPATTVH